MVYTGFTYCTGLANDPIVEPTSGGFDVNEAYVEFAIPLLADAPFAQNVELSAALRAFDYSTLALTRLGNLA